MRKVFGFISCFAGFYIVIEAGRFIERAAPSWQFFGLAVIGGILLAVSDILTKD